MNMYMYEHVHVHVCHVYAEHVITINQPFIHMGASATI
jgi:hypothetical protein